MIRQFLFATPEFDEALGLRDELLRQPLGLDFHVRDIQKEFDSYHFGFFDSFGQMRGCLTMVPVDDRTVKMRQVAVSTQKMGIGRALVEYSETWAKKKGYGSIVLHARDEAVPFYLKLGYLKEGNPFTEVGIKHFKMRKPLA